MTLRNQKEKKCSTDHWCLFRAALNSFSHSTNDRREEALYIVNKKITPKQSFTNL